MRPDRQGDEITLSGPPRSMTGVYPFEVSGSTVVPISLSVGGESTIYRAVVRAERNEIRLRLPGETAPGSYTGEATIEGKACRVVAHVEPIVRIRVQPRQTSVTAAPTAQVEFCCSVMNEGNVPFAVPKADVFDLDDAAGQDKALGRTLRAPLTGGERRIDRFFDELRDSHGGEARVAVRNGAGPLEPGESRELACVLTVPATAQAGRSYVGSWPLGNAAHVIVAEILTGTTGARPDNGRAKA